ncbi:MAG: 30S ribosomal protein S5 [Candidatus Paceibacterota bacterium]|jgi:small subunit ribosomal protein S5
MSEDTVTTESTEVKEESLVVQADAPVAAAPAKGAFPPRRNDRNDRKPRREPRAKPEFDQRILNIRRVTRVSSGGRRFSFSVAMVVGNHKGIVGVGTGKAGDTSLAIDKATRAARKQAITVKTTPSMSIPHEVFAKDKSAYVHIQPARGKGIIAGSSVRDIIELAGLKDINAKLRSTSKNKLNAARATIKALQSLKTPIIREKKERIVK